LLRHNETGIGTAGCGQCLQKSNVPKKDDGMTKKIVRAFALAWVFFGAGISAGQAETVSLVAHLLGSAAVPATHSDAFGEAQFTYHSDTRQLEYFVNYDGVAPTRVDIHGPASVGENAAAIVTIPVSDSPINGTATLTQEQAGELLGGKLYLDIHSRAHADGDIRGQIQKQ
jgi:hypothetical protein